MSPNKKSRVSPANSVAPVGIECLPFDPPYTKMRRQRPADLDLKPATAFANAGSRRQPLAWVQRDCIDLSSRFGARSDPNDIRSQPIEIDYRSEIFPEA